MKNFFTSNVLPTSLFLTLIIFCQSYSVHPKLGLLQLRDGKQVNPTPLLAKHGNRFVLSAEQKQNIHLGILGLPYVRDAYIRADQDFAIYFIADYPHNASQHIFSFLSNYYDVGLPYIKASFKECTTEEATKKFLMTYQKPLKM